MPALQLDIEIEKGATFQRLFTVTPVYAGNALDLTTYTIAGVINDLSGTKLADITIAAVTAATILIEVPEAINKDFPTTTTFQHKYDVLASKVGAPDYRIAQGNVLISGAQTVIP